MLVERSSFSEMESGPADGSIPERRYTVDVVFRIRTDHSKV